MNKKILIPIIVVAIFVFGIGTFFVLQKPAFPEPQTGRCGDGICDGHENERTCPQDCKSTIFPEPQTGRCGDGICDGHENERTCPQDCKSTIEIETHGPERYLSFNIWNWEIRDLKYFENIVDIAKKKGFNTISLAFAWNAIEPTQNNFNFEQLDKRVDYIVEQELNVILRVSYIISPDWIDQNYLMKEEGGNTYESPYGGEGIVVITDSQVREWMERLLVKIVERYQNRYTSNPIVYYSIPFGPAGETEYPFNLYLDYSPQSQKDFQQWLQNKHSTINNLNKRWETSYSTFFQVTIPKLAQGGSPAWTDWLNYRTFALKRLFDQLAKAVHDVDQNAKIGLQFGSIWDAISAARGTYDAAKLIENVDWVIVDDAPTYNHKFSMDLLRTIAKGKQIGNEIDDPGIYPSDDLILTHGLESFNYGADMVHFANWDKMGRTRDGGNVVRINNPQWIPILSKLAEEAKKPVSIIEEPKIAIYVSTMAQYLNTPQYRKPQQGLSQGVDTYAMIKETYQMLTKGETQPVAIVTDSLLVDDPAFLNKYTEGVYLPAFNRIISDEVYAAFQKAAVPLYVENRDVGIKNEYGDLRIPTIFNAYPSQ